jgi:hypothetical protein
MDAVRAWTQVKPVIEKNALVLKWARALPTFFHRRGQRLMLARFGFVLLLSGIALAINHAGGAEPAAAPEQKPLVLSYITQGLKQEIVVTEKTDFYTSSEIRESKWVISGKIGEVKGGKVKVEIGIDTRFGGSREKTSRSYELTVNATEAQPEAGSGSVIGNVPIDGVWIRRGHDPWPYLLKGLAARDECFYGAVDYVRRLGRGAAPAVPLFGQALSSDTEEIRIVAANSLGRIGAPAEPALPLLQELADRTNDKDASDAATAAIAEIEADVRKQKPRR